MRCPDRDKNPVQASLALEHVDDGDEATVGAAGATGAPMGATTGAAAGELAGTAAGAAMGASPGHAVNASSVAHVDPA